MPTMIYFEQPLNERIRNLLRLELLFKQLRHFAGRSSVWDSRMVVGTMLDILEQLARTDMKTELIKELERALGNMEKLMSNPGVDHKRLQTVLRALETLSSTLHNGETPGQKLRDDPLIGAVRQRNSVSGAICDFDLPLYHLWLESEAEHRQETQKAWLAQLEPLRQSVDLLLKLLRNSADPRNLRAESGIFQQNLEASLPHQMIRVALSSEHNCFAEISGGRHRFTIRFLEPQATGRPLLTHEDIPFQLAVCAL